MREQLTQYVNLLFAGTPNSEDMQQEILQNTLDRYDDLIDQGKTPEAAYRLAIAGIGDINEILSGEAPVQAAAPSVTVEILHDKKTANSKKKLMHAIAIALYICCVIPLFVLGNIGDGILGLCLMFVIIAIATLLIIMASGGEKQAESEKKGKQPEKSIWSTITLVIYLALSFATQAWHITWLVFPIAGAIEGLVKSFKLSERSKSILRAIPYTLLIAILIFILIACLGLRYFPLNLPLSTGTPVEGELTLDAATVKNLQIDWASGNVSVQTADVDHITISESTKESTKHKMTYLLDGETLQLSFSNRVYIFGNGSMPSKDLIVTVPEDWVCEDLEIDGASITIDISSLQTKLLTLDGASCTLNYHGSVDQVDIDGASMDIHLVCTNRVSAIDVDGVSCDLELTLPYECGFVVDVDGLSYGFHSDLPFTTEGDKKVYGDQHCRISVDGLSCEVNIAQAPSEPPEDTECTHTWDGGTQVSPTEIRYTCTLCGETNTETFDSLLQQHKYVEAASLASEGKKAEAAIAFARLGNFMDARERCIALWSEVRTNTTVVAFNTILYGIQSDGTVILHAFEDNYFSDTAHWTQLCGLAIGADHLVGLRTDGTVVATGDNTYGQCDVSNWTDIVAIDCGAWFTVGLKADGTVVLAGVLEHNLDKAKGWTDMVMLEAAGNNLVGLRCDGTALATGKEENELWLVPEWNDIIDIYLDHERAIYLRADGTFLIMGNALYIDNQQLPGLLTVESDGVYLAGQMLDGSMYFNGYNYPHDISTKGHIVAIIDYSLQKLGLCSDGTLVHLFFYSESKVEAPKWSNIMLP